MSELLVPALMLVVAVTWALFGYRRRRRNARLADEAARQLEAQRQQARDAFHNRRRRRGR